MATQTVGVCNVLSTMDEVFGRSYQLTQNGGGSKMSENPSSMGTAGSKLDNGSSVVLANCNRNHSLVGVASTATNTSSSNNNNNSALQQPPSYQSAVTATDNCSPTRVGSVRNTAASNGGLAQQHLLTEKPPSHNGNKTNSNCDVLL